MYLSADEIVMATGSKSMIPPVEGRSEEVIAGYGMISGKVSIPSGDVLIVGGGMVVIEVHVIGDAREARLAVSNRQGQGRKSALPLLVLFMNCIVIDLK